MTEPYRARASHHDGGVAGVVVAAAPEGAPDDGTHLSFLPLAGRRLLSRSVAALAAVSPVRILVVVRAGDRELAERILDRECEDLPWQVVTANGHRGACEYAALRRLRWDIRSGAVGIVLVHDTVHPLAGRLVVSEVVAMAQQFHAAVPGLAMGDFVEPRPDGHTALAYATERYLRVQSPSGFSARMLLDSFERADADGLPRGDAAAYFRRYAGIWPRSVPGDPRNVTVEHAHDLFRAERILAEARYAPL